ncbi:MAG: hypothetical protein ACI93R_000610 [Flavobacteriales bacterium]|jgi:hypothetical protein
MQEYMYFCKFFFSKYMCAIHTSKVFIFTGIALVMWFSSSTCASPGKPDITKIPLVTLEEHPGWEDLYIRAFEIAFSKIQQGTKENGFVDYYMDEAFSANIFQWDTSFIMMFARYGNQELPSIVSLENFYRYQHDDGWIGRELREKDGSSYWPKSGSLEANCSINPPLFSWAEWQDYQVRGDISRFSKRVNDKTILDVLVDYYDWIKANRRWDNQLYWTTSYANGMDRSPRLATDHVCSHADGSWIDITAQQALNALYISKIAAEVGDKKLQTRFEREHAEIKTLINTSFWDDEDGFYYDLTKDGEFFKVKTPASFWVLIADVTNDKQERRLVNEHILDPERFWTEHHLPTVSKDEETYMKDGGYWDGAVWAPTTYQTIKGLEFQGFTTVARRIAMNHIQNLYWVYRSTNTLHENYRPETVAKGVHARDDFVGWTGVGPIAALIENVMGIQVNGAGDSLIWDVNLAERHGIKNLQFGDNTVSLMADDRLDKNSGVKVKVTTDSPFTLKLKVAGKVRRFDVAKGNSEFTLGKVLKGLTSVATIHKGLLGQNFGKANSEKIFQTFVAPNSGDLRGIDLKLQKEGGHSQSDVVAELFATKGGKPIGKALAKAKVKADDVEPFFGIYHAKLRYKHIKAGASYAVVVSQKSTSDESYYQWLAGEEVHADFHFGGLSQNGEAQNESLLDEEHSRKEALNSKPNNERSNQWQHNTAVGDAWMKAYIQSK